MLDEIRSTANRTIGTRQTRKALERDDVVKIFVARDAKEDVVDPVVEMGQEQQVEIECVDSMIQLGQACGIAVGAAVAAVLRDESTPSNP